MDLPALQKGEHWRVLTQGVYVRTYRFNAFLTDRRVILKSPDNPLMPEKDLFFNRIEGVESYTNDNGEPILAILATASHGECRRLVLTFSQTPGGHSRDEEREEWVRHLSGFPVNPVNQSSGNPTMRSHGRIEEPGPRQDTGKLVFSPVTCNSETDRSGPTKNDGGVQIQNSYNRFLPSHQGSSPEIESDRGNRKYFPEKKDMPGSLPPAVHPGFPDPGIEQSAGNELFFCSMCGNRVLPGSQFCDRCGKGVTAPAPVRPVHHDSSSSISGLNDCSPGFSGNDGPRVASAGSDHGNRVRQFPTDVMMQAHDNKETDKAGNKTGADQPAEKKQGLFGGLSDIRRRISRLKSGGIQPTAGYPELGPRTLQLPPKGITVSIAAIILIIIIAAGVLLFVTSPESNRVFGNIIPVNISFGKGNSTSMVSTLETSKPVTSVTESGSRDIHENISSIPSDGVCVRIQYLGSWSGAIGMPDALQDIRDNGERIICIENADDMVTAEIKKGDSTSNKITVELFRNGQMIATGDTTDPGGSVILTGSL